ncbi:MAG: hypothetical protein K2G67_07490, partial [Muribaculaceae bacterium]|nr:hypothetical protein [Muribaculaceae bacterium]
FKEIANFQNIEGESSHQNAHACRISTPRQGVSIFGMAWEWTVYSMSGVWRCLLEDRQEIIPRFFVY